MAVEVLDVMRAEVREFRRPRRLETVRCDLLIAGGGLSGIAAALRATARGLRVCLLEETDWLGGQITAQGVSALDEHAWIEHFGATAAYAELRRRIRDHYRPLLRAPAPEDFNPGNAWVSRLCFEPRVALEAINQMLAPAIGGRRLKLFPRTKAAAISRAGARIRRVLAVNLDSADWLAFEPKYAIEAAELGELLPLASEPYTVGAEPAARTGEPHAYQPSRSRPAPPAARAQSLTYTFAVSFHSNQTHPIARPPGYQGYAAAGRYSFHYTYPGVEKSYRMFESCGDARPFWTYRRLIDAAQFRPQAYPRDIAMINWQGHDFCGAGLYSADPHRQARALAEAKRVSLGFLYWLQNEAPRDDGGRGYPELKLRPEVMGTEDGLSKLPYVRESRRGRALETVREQDISAEFNPHARARLAPNSVGIGQYFIDLHHCRGPRFSAATRPFQIPLGVLIPRHTENLILAGKNIGTTHLANGAFRLQPVEWAIGEAAGELAALAIESGRTPGEIHARQELTRTLQRRLVEGGAPLFWFVDVPLAHPAFPAVQYLAATGRLAFDPGSLEFRPDSGGRGEEAIRLWQAEQ